MARYFTITEAEAMLPKVEARIRDALFLKSEYQRTEDELRATTRKILLSGGATIDRNHVATVKNTREQLASKLQQTCEEIQEFGCLVKDLDIGLIDFPTIYSRREVYLCWKLGEDRIRFWHEIESGFRGRQEITDEFLRDHGKE
jgi:hypothetical protein